MGGGNIEGNSFTGEAPKGCEIIFLSKLVSLEKGKNMTEDRLRHYIGSHFSLIHTLSKDHIYRYSNPIALPHAP